MPRSARPRITRAHLADAGRVEPVGRLVEDAQLGVGQQRRGDAEALLHPERVGAHEVVGAVGEPDGLEHLGDPRARQAAEPRQHLEVAPPESVG